MKNKTLHAAPCALRFLAAFFLMFACLNGGAATITWTNTAGGNWGEPMNWSPNQVPGPLNAPNSPDDVLITNAGTYTVVFDVGVLAGSWNIRSLTLGTGGGANGTNTLSVANNLFYDNLLTVSGGGILTNYNSTFYPVINVQNGGQLNSHAGTYFGNPLTIASGGTLNANGDTFHQNTIVAAGGVFNTLGATIASDGSLTVAGTLNVLSQTLTMYGPMTNSGIVNIDSNAGIYIYNNGFASYQGSLLNLPGGTINLNGFNGIQGSFGNDYFINQGAVISTGNGAQINVSDFDNFGGVVTNLSAGGYLYLGKFTNTLAGTYYATNGTIIQFTGGAASAPLTPGSPLVLAGGGQYRFASGWLELPTDIIPNLQLTGGQLELGANFQGGAITNLTLNGITLTNFNNWSVTGVFNLTNSPVYGNYTVENGATLTAYGATFHGHLTVAAGGLFTTPGAAIASDGSLTMDGTLNIPAGVLTLYGPMTNSGIVSIYSNGGIYIYNNNTANYQGGLINLPIGAINLNGFNGIQGGFGNDYFINQGSVVSTVNGAQISMSDFTNSGAITSQEGTLHLNKVALQSSGSLGVRLNSASDYGKLSISGAAILNGAFNATLNGDYIPAYGTSFNVLSYGSFSGNFNSFDLPLEIIWQPEYSSTVFTLMVGQPQFSLSLSGTNLVFNANGGALGNKGVLLTSPDLTLPLAQWTPLTTNTFDADGHFNFTNGINANASRQFYILKYP